MVTELGVIRLKLRIPCHLYWAANIVMSLILLPFKTNMLIVIQIPLVYFVPSISLF